MNWWASPPKYVQRAPPEDIIERGLSPAPASLQERVAAEGAKAEPRWRVLTPTAGSEGVQATLEAVLIHTLECVHDEPKSQPEPEPAQEPEPAPEPAPEPERESARRRASRIASLHTGSDTKGAVLIDHPGYMVYQTPLHDLVLLPIEAES